MSKQAMENPKLKKHNDFAVLKLDQPVKREKYFKLFPLEWYDDSAERVATQFVEKLRIAGYPQDKVKCDSKDDSLRFSMWMNSGVPKINR